MDGKVGADVAALTIHAFGQTVETSIKDGTYAAWWPGQAPTLSELLPPSGEGGPEPQPPHDVTLTDGTVLTDVAPSRPSDGALGDHRLPADLRTRVRERRRDLGLGGLQGALRPSPVPRTRARFGDLRTLPMPFGVLDGI